MSRALNCLHLVFQLAQCISLCTPIQKSLALVTSCTCVVGGVGWDAGGEGWEVKRALVSPLPMAGMRDGVSDASSLWEAGVEGSSLGGDCCSCKCNHRHIVISTVYLLIPCAVSWSQRIRPPV